MPFKHTPPTQATKTSKSRNMADMRECMTDEEWNKSMQQLLLRRLQYEMLPGDLVSSWALEHCDLFYDIMQEYTAQKRWHNLDLTPCQQVWANARKETGDNGTLPLIQTVLEQMGQENDGVQGPGSVPAAGSKRHASEAPSGELRRQPAQDRTEDTGSSDLSNEMDIVHKAAT
ncbi:hypothetical protein GE09DRAFT_519946 [Coniochaeta sp. 2T2.1]|nr:hypothetical protein GE09DRAFT_519946 [Coniochaeta sp. 2T2.1]